MKYLLDTNTCIRFLNARSEALVERLSFTPDEQICVCSIVKAEMFFGSIKSRDPVRTRAIQERFFSRYTSLVFDDRCADFYANIRADFERAGKPIGPNDLLIASIALAHNLIVVTANESEFIRVKGIQVQNWE